MEMNYKGDRTLSPIISTNPKRPSEQDGIKILQECLTPIPSPDAAYLASTTKIDISSIPNGTLLNSITDGVQTVTFATQVQKLSVPSGGWATWSSPPQSESATPDVLFTSAESQTLTLSVPASTFGFELETNFGGTTPVIADFYSGNTLVGTITRDVNFYEGALLFAGTTCGPCIDKVVITSVPEALGFAIAQVRYSPCVPPPSRGVDFSKLDIEA